MSGDKRHEEPREITAQPKRMRDELRESPVVEQGLSIDPEELGQQFLSEGTNQGNFESYDDGAEMSITGNAPSDAALTGPSFEVDQSLWESTIDLSLQTGGVDEVSNEYAQRTRPSEDDESAATRDEEEQEPGDLDVTEDVIREASLLDAEGAELGEVESPEPKTDDIGTHRRRRGGSQSRSL